MNAFFWIIVGMNIDMSLRVAVRGDYSWGFGLVDLILIALIICHLRTGARL